MADIRYCTIMFEFPESGSVGFSVMAFLGSGLGRLITISENTEDPRGSIPGGFCISPSGLGAEIKTLCEVSVFNIVITGAAPECLAVVMHQVQRDLLPWQYRLFNVRNSGPFVQLAPNGLWVPATADVRKVRMTSHVTDRVEERIVPVVAGQLHMTHVTIGSDCEPKVPIAVVLPAVPGTYNDLNGQNVADNPTVTFEVQAS